MKLFSLQHLKTSQVNSVNFHSEVSSGCGKEKSVARLKQQLAGRGAASFFFKGGYSTVHDAIWRIVMTPFEAPREATPSPPPKLLLPTPMGPSRRKRLGTTYNLCRTDWPLPPPPLLPHAVPPTLLSPVGDIRGTPWLDRRRGKRGGWTDRRLTIARRSNTCASYG